MEKKSIRLTLLWKQRVYFDGKIQPMSYIDITEHCLYWATINDIVYVCIPFSQPRGNGIMLPIKETEKFMKSEYKRLFDIDIPEDVHQWPYKKEEE